MLLSQPPKGRNMIKSVLPDCGSKAVRFFVHGPSLRPSLRPSLGPSLRPSSYPPITDVKLVELIGQTIIG